MSKTIEDTLKALVEFESELDVARADASEARIQMVKKAGEWAERAKADAIAKAQQVAAETLARARDEAEKEAESIRKKGEAALKGFQGSISKHQSDAAQMVAKILLGESS